MSTQHPLKVFEEREVVGMRLFEGDDACGMNQIPKSWCIEVDHSPSKVHRGMVVEKTSIREVNDGLADRAFSTSRCTMDEQKFHRSCRTRVSHRWRQRGLPQGNADVEPGTARRLRVDRDLASERTHPLAHADESEPTLALDLPGVEPTPVIDDPHRNRVRSPTQCDLGLLGAAVLDGISQSLLGDAIEAHGRIR